MQEFSNYFHFDINSDNRVNFIKDRRQRVKVLKSNRILKFNTGDILSVVF